MRIYFSDKSHAKSVASSFKKHFSTVYHPENHQRTLNDFAVLVGYRNYKDLISVTRQESSVVLWSPDEINSAVQRLPDYNQGILKGFCCRYLSQWPRGHYMTPPLVECILNGKHDLILAIGQTGTGKSTAIQEVAALLKSQGLKVYFIASATGDFAPVDCEIHENISDWRISENGQDDFKKFDVHSIEGARARGEVYLTTRHSFEFNDTPLPFPNGIKRLDLETVFWTRGPSGVLRVLDGDKPAWYSGFLGRQASSLVGSITEGVILLSQENISDLTAGARFRGTFQSALSILQSEVQNVSHFYKNHPGYIRYRPQDGNNPSQAGLLFFSNRSRPYSSYLSGFMKIKDNLEAVMFDGGIIYSVQRRSKGVVYIASLMANSCEDAYQKWKSLGLLKGLENKPVLSIHRYGSSSSEIGVQLNS